jgi:hypothetical protein
MEGSRLASWSSENTFSIWDSATGQHICELDISVNVLRRGIDPNPGYLRTTTGGFEVEHILSAYTNFEESPYRSWQMGYGFEKTGSDWLSILGQNFLWLPPDYRFGESDLCVSDDKAKFAMICSTGRVWTMSLLYTDLVSITGKKGGNEPR